MHMNTYDKYAYRLLFALVLVTLTVGTIFYHIVEKFSFVDSYYFSVVTLATVGYGDFVPHTTLGKLFTTLYMLLGVAIITAFLGAVTRKRAAKMMSRVEQRQEDKKA